ncbi:MAG: hypothetical protein HUJ75_01155 [Parasporobacterium sp.]|nr:hypothetical protein [Parasporobacterium sp.]
MADIQEYKCPNCGGAISFDSSSQKLKCPYCDAEFDIEAVKAYDNILNNQTAQDEMRWQTPGKVWQEADTEGMRVYVCKSCGGQIIGDENMGASKCPYCDNPIVLMGQFAGDLKPDCIIPFKLDKEAAKKALLEHYKGKPFLPNTFKNANHIDEIKGIYVPFWLFDAKSHGQAHYQATRVRTWSDSQYRYTKTDYFHLEREGSAEFRHIPVDGSSVMADDLMESLEPYDFSEAVDFQTAYMAGYMADRYDVDAEASIGRANQRIKTSTEQALASTTSGYATVNAASSVVSTTDGVTRYAMYPVWILNTTWNKQKYTFAMNGQTGKMAGDLPVDKSKMLKTGLLAGAIAAVSCLAVQIILNLLGLF